MIWWDLILATWGMFLLTPDNHIFAAKVLLGFSNRILAKMEYTGGKHGIGLAQHETFIEVLEVSHTA